MLARAERLNRELFRPLGSKHGCRPGSLRSICWKPNARFSFSSPCRASTRNRWKPCSTVSDLVVAGTRALPDELRTAIIHRLELPQGRFERRVRLPARELQRGAPLRQQWMPADHIGEAGALRG